MISIRRISVLILVLASASSSASMFNPLALHRAAQAGDMAKVEKLLKKGADPNELGGGIMPLHSAAVGGHVEIAKRLIAAGARVNGQTGKGSTALMLAVRAKHAAMAEYLVSAGTDVNLPNAEAQTPLMLAAETGQTDITATLLAHGASVRAVNNDGDTALLYAARDGYPEIAQQLIAAGADVNFVSSRSTSALGNAIGARNKPLVQLLLANGADWRKVDATGGSFLRRTASWGDPEILDYFLKEKIAVDAKDADGATALHCAARAGSVQAFQMLVASGADINIASKSEGTPLHAAARNHKIDIAITLIGLGATPTDATAGNEVDSLGTGLEHMLYADEQLRRGDRALAAKHYTAARPYIQSAEAAYRKITEENRKEAAHEGSLALIDRMNQPIVSPVYEMMMAAQGRQLADVAALRNAPSMDQFASYRDAFAQRYAEAVHYGLSGSGTTASPGADDRFAFYSRLMTSSADKQALATAWLAEIDRKMKCAETAEVTALAACAVPVAVK